MNRLEEVVEAFEAWRSSRTNQKEATPKRLWMMAKSLMPYYKKSQIQRALGVNGSRLRDYTSGKAISSLGDGFAEGSFDLGQPFHLDEVCELILKGRNKSLEIKTTIQNMSAILSMVAEYL